MELRCSAPESPRFKIGDHNDAQHSTMRQMLRSDHASHSPSTAKHHGHRKSSPSAVRRSAICDKNPLLHDEPLLGLTVATGLLLALNYQVDVLDESCTHLSRKEAQRSEFWASEIRSD